MNIDLETSIPFKYSRYNDLNETILIITKEAAVYTKSRTRSAC